MIQPEGEGDHLKVWDKGECSNLSINMLYASIVSLIMVVTDGGILQCPLLLSVSFICLLVFLLVCL